MSDYELGIIGLGAMGENLAKHALESDIDVVGVNTRERSELEEMGATVLSRLAELMRDQLQEDALEDIPNYVEDTGEVNWLVQEAFKGETPIPVITQSVMELFRSRGNQQNAYRAVTAMRKGFGGHPCGEDEGIREQRITGRAGNESRQDLAADAAMDTTGPVDRDN